MYGIIYCYTNLVNHKKYIGQTINPEQRFKQHKSSAFNEKDQEYNSLLHRAFRKYGYENFSYEIIAKANTIEELNKLEIFYIQEWNTKSPNGYNIEDGGQNAQKPKTEEQKEKMCWSHAKLTKEEVEYLRKAYANKEKPSIIYKEKYKDKMHYNSFLNIWTGQRYKNVMPEVFEEKYRHTKINEDLVRAIRKDRNSLNLTYQALADKYNVNKSTVADIVKKRTWKNV